MQTKGYVVSRGITRTWRPLTVWLGVTAVAGAALAAGPGAWKAVDPAAGAAGTADLVVAGCATVLALALAWLWVITSATVAELLLTGTAPARRGTARQLVLLACGAAVMAGTTVPAVATGGDGRELLVGLPLPERAVAPARQQPHHRQPDAQQGALPTTPPAATGGTYVVRPGDSLWSIARAHPVPGTDVDRRWRAIWLANRVVVGADPDLIHPGQELRLPDDTDDRQIQRDEDGAR